MEAVFHFPTRILFGEGVVGRLAEEVSGLGGSRVLLVTDPGIVRVGLAGRVQEVLEGAGLAVRVFDQVSPNPTDAQADAGAEAFLDFGADCVVGLGGGSPLDAAKAVCLRVHHREPMAVYDDLAGGDARITGPLPPLLAVPTTAGTGSEVSRSAVITVPSVGRKVVVFSPRLMPKVAVCDPELTYGLPPRLTASTGLDALCHNVEAYLARGWHPMADAIALEGVRLVARSLRRAVADGRDVEARRNMLAASTMGAVAFQKGLGVVHSLAHALGAVAGVAHGEANAVILPHALRFDARRADGETAARLKALSAALGAESDEPAAAAEAVARLASDVGLPGDLKGLGVTAEMADEVVDKAMADGCHPQNPVPVSRQDMRELFFACLGEGEEGR